MVPIFRTLRSFVRHIYTMLLLCTHSIDTIWPGRRNPQFFSCLWRPNRICQAGEQVSWKVHNSIQQRRSILLYETEAGNLVLDQCQVKHTCSHLVLVLGLWDSHSRCMEQFYACSIDMRNNSSREHVSHGRLQRRRRLEGRRWVRWRRRRSSMRVQASRLLELGLVRSIYGQAGHGVVVLCDKHIGVSFSLIGNWVVLQSVNKMLLHLF